MDAPRNTSVPSEHRDKLYALGSPNPPEELAKRNYVSRVMMSEATQVRRLLNHYESSIKLTNLELMSVAFECFTARKTNPFSKADTAYALMGLLSRRLEVIPNESGYEAFARLSFANDSNALLERLLCMQPRGLDTPWNEFRDAWGASLWDIEPHCQVAGIVDDQTVLLDGAYRATIQWDRTDQVPTFKRPTLARTFAKIALRGAPIHLINGLVITILGVLMSKGFAKSAGIAMLATGSIFLIPAIIIALVSPSMIMNLYGGKFWSTQAHFIGPEGIPEHIGSLEDILFGVNQGRLKWSTAGSTLSRHQPSSSGDDECVAQPPITPSLNGKDSGSLFTLVDTYSMTATAFKAARPPTTVMICGQEGGMQRAVLCSYDFKRATFSREAVVRLQTTVLNRISSVDRFRFALSRNEAPVT